MEEEDLDVKGRWHFKSDRKETISVQIVNGGLVTNYWSLDVEAAGFFMIIPNGGLLHLLVPRTHIDYLARMSAAKMAILTAGDYPGWRGVSFELLFEDGSMKPFALFLDEQQVKIPHSELERHDNETAKLDIWSHQIRQPSHVKRLLLGFRKRPKLPTGGEPW